jgi:hypothetical protein
MSCVYIYDCIDIFIDFIIKNIIGNSSTYLTTSENVSKIISKEKPFQSQDSNPHLTLSSMICSNALNPYATET